MLRGGQRYLAEKIPFKTWASNVLLSLLTFVRKTVREYHAMQPFPPVNLTTRTASSAVIVIVIVISEAPRHTQEATLAPLQLLPDNILLAASTHHLNEHGSSADI